MKAASTLDILSHDTDSFVAISPPFTAAKTWCVKLPRHFIMELVLGNGTWKRPAVPTDRSEDSPWSLDDTESVLGGQPH